MIEARSGLAILASLLLMASVAWSTPPRIEVEALFTDAAVLKIDGERKMLRAGQSYKGVTLVAAYSRTATLEVDGETMVLGTSRRIGTQYETAESQVVKIPRDAMLQYQTAATINGRTVQVLVDTGANIVALNSSHADALGVNYRAGAPGRVETASGSIEAWIVTLRSIDVGGIQVDNVRASVVEGDFPSTILLGMTYLKHVEMRENDGILSLSRAW
jgi:aspartyl protease family protein